MTYESFSELLEELVFMGTNPHDDLPSVVHYVNQFGKFTLVQYHRWLAENPNPQVRQFQV
jgi:hypothetical protein